MGEVRIGLTVYFEDPFWVGVFERTVDGRLTASGVVFGAEPRDYEVHAYVLRYYSELRFSPAVAAARSEETHNHKRAQRRLRRELSSTGIGTRSQQALKLLQEQGKQERKIRTREEKQAREDRLFALKQQKKRDKHRGH